LKNSPHLEAAKEKVYEVLYLSDSVDELLVQHLTDFEGKHLKSVTKGKVRWETEEEKQHLEEQLKQKEEEYADFLQACQKKLDQYLKQIRFSARLVSSPTCLVTEEHEYSPNRNACCRKEKVVVRNSGVLWNSIRTIRSLRASTNVSSWMVRIR
jgi:molecular chaperone HtpG